ncbi:MAG: class I SAM-dependent methyltransferase [Chthoniobacterales bacterium]|nr:class I SAM-dependent methyltransferase [Chthoniobacterales bacterium]
MNTRKSFETIHGDYRFFGSHSTEGDALRETLLPILRERTQKHVRWMDFGCGSGGFLGELLAALDRPPADIDLALVDVDRGYLEEAREAVAGFTASEVAVATAPEELAGAFDLITSKHALYYVKDLRSTVRTLCGMLKPGGLAIFMLGGKTNHLSGLWETAYAARNLPVPYFRAEDVAREIQATGLTHESLAVPSVVRFPDARENRLKFLRFFFAGNTAGMTPESLLPLLDPLAKDGDVVIDSACSVFLVSR